MKGNGVTVANKKLPQKRKTQKKQRIEPNFHEFLKGELQLKIKRGIFIKLKNPLW